MTVSRPSSRPLRRPRGVRVDAALALLAVIAVVLAVALLFVGIPQVPALPAFTSAPATPTARVTPNVVGKDLNEAARILLSAGFRDTQGRQVIPWEAQAGASGTPCTVVRQEPASGSTYQTGAAAKLFLVPGRC